jgi:hypothetical protein
MDSSIINIVKNYSIDEINVAADTIVNKDELEMSDDDVIEYLISELNQQLF